MKDKIGSALINTLPASPHLEIIYDYYSRLNNKRPKYKVFQQVQDKSSLMNLHQFMIFCKRFKITKKHHKHHNPANNNQQVANDKQRGEKKKKVQKKDVNNNDQQVEMQGQKMLYEQKRNEKNENIWVQQPLKKQSDKNFDEQSQPEKIQQNIEPFIFLKQSAVAQIFKKYVSTEGQITYQSFIEVLKNMSKLMYQEQKLDKKKRKSKEVKTSEKNPFEEEWFFKLLKFLRLESKENVVQTYIQINEQDGNKYHLSMLRSPIKKIQLKNDPLGKYATNTTNNTNTTDNNLVFLHNQSKKYQKSFENMPVIKPTKYSKFQNPVEKRKQTKGGNVEDRLQNFLKSNESQIYYLNKGYIEKEQFKVQISEVNQTFQLPKQDHYQKNSRLLHCSHVTQKQTNKYSQRHKVKILGDLTNKQIGRLIDVENLYEDDIFNKYIQINHKKQADKRHPRN